MTSGPKSYRDFGETAPGPAVSMSRNKIFCSFIYKAMGNKYYQMRTWYIQVKFIWSSIAIVTSPIIHLVYPPPSPQILHSALSFISLGATVIPRMNKKLLEENKVYYWRCANGECIIKVVIRSVLFPAMRPLD